MISLLDMLPTEKKRHNTFGLLDMFEGVKDAILPILSNTPYGSAARIIKEHGGDFTREVGEGFYHDLPQGILDLGTDIVNRGANLLGVEGDFIDRKSVQVVPQVFDEAERKQLGMKSLEEDSVGRILGQLLGGYAGIRSVASKGLLGEVVSVAGAGATLDPERPNLSNFIQDTKFNNALFEYMSAGVDEEASAQERLLARVGTMTEELGLAFLPVGLIQGIRAIKNNPAAKAELLEVFNPDRVFQTINKRTSGLLDLDPRMWATTYHGSGNQAWLNQDIPRFNKKYMGSGEGNQAKGYGFYLADRMSTAKDYFRQGLDETDLIAFEEEVVRRMMKSDKSGNPLVKEMWKDVRDNQATPHQVGHLLEKYKDHADLPQLKAAIKEYQELFAEQPFSLFKVDLPDKNLATFLDDSKTVYDQPKVVQDMLRDKNGAYMDLVDKYKPLQKRRDFITSLMKYKDSAEPEALLKLKTELDDIIVKQQSILDEIGQAGRGDFPHPTDGEGIYKFLVGREGTLRPTANMEGIEQTVSEMLDSYGIMGRKWKDRMSTDYPELYNSENYVIFNEDVAKILERNEVPVKKPMIAQHVLSEQALEKHLEATGIPMPSIATSLVEKPVTDFGEISLLSDPSMITPSRTTKTYPTDMYSGRAPYDQLVYKDVNAVLDSIDPEVLRFHANVKPIDDPEAMTTYNTKMNKGQLLEGKVKGKLQLKENHTGVLEAQMKMVDKMIELGYDPYKYPTYREARFAIDEDLRATRGYPLTPVPSDHIPEEGLLGETVRKMTHPKGQFTDLGNRRQDVPYSAEDALKVMRRRKGYKPGAEGFETLNQTIALASTPFKNLDEIKKNRGLLEDKKGYSEGDAQDMFEFDLDRMKDALHKLGGNTEYSNTLVDDVLRSGRITAEDMAYMKYTPEQAKEAEKLILSLKEKGRQLNSEQWAKENPEIADLTTTHRQLSTAYFETKPNKIIDIAEFKGAIIPKETKPRIIELLKNKGIKKILTYGSYEQRIKLFDKFPELHFIGLAIPTAGLLSNFEEEKQGLL